MGCLQTNSYSELPETRAILPVDPQSCSPSSFSEANPGSLKITPLACLACAKYTSNPRSASAQECRLRLNGHRLYCIISLFKVTYGSTIQVSRNFHALFTKTLENSDNCD